MTRRQIILLLILMGVSLYALVTWNDTIDQVVVAIPEPGTLLVDGEAMSVEDLVQRIEQRAASGTLVAVRIDAAPDVPTGDVLDVMNRAEAAGATKVDIDTP